ncbi:PREDICTED: uncharacterized protein LOC104782619 [Camelina sativa]|uniref:Uncharacterized protein LOC104782619 n=1 Tax=Camelina sativa TaxID=90675 RepID=A0ABM1RNH3_CAMSA|nr:PREDICTED: uncharacterized protein LOC104782619 [Camelina sativa]XP_010505905.1 PREDICTED: uncharacterized protein LOC104782619 [Camelina sativa]XP_010505911.1 PREDICTED: uncharacterized protein LOC104782619 [Camelina sativa]XP_019100560.1 PREDICTED: uncharacterized protein LOC104782619 [Camelina sativa]XP_019100561.1 PREDICTED: uncharacterized protein LOC104782619 [Camelina sativa]XP_019100562.1 PREDICTED: uncharacterized protein LOC104782619 [Camelina sativa]XP_019100563.1 PREDICTED: unc
MVEAIGGACVVSCNHPRLGDPTHACQEKWWWFLPIAQDIAALWYPLNEKKAEWVIYVAEVFFTLNHALRKPGWLPVPANDLIYPRASHVCSLEEMASGSEICVRCYRILAQLEDDVVPWESQMGNWKTNLEVMAVKEEQYIQQYKKYEMVLNRVGYTPEISHRRAGRNGRAPEGIGEDDKTCT